MSYRLGILGGGNMAEAIVRGALATDAFDADDFIVSDPDSARRALFEELGLAVTDNNGEVIGQTERVLLAVKPQTLEKITDDLKKIDGEGQGVLSIMAGVSTAKLAEAMGQEEARLVRVMPNTPLLVGKGMAAIARGPHATEADETFALELFRGAGEAVVVAEKSMDAVTAVSGSGPAYAFYLAEAMVDAATELGLAEQLAEQLVRQTLLGAATLLHQSDETAAELRRRVTSPGGTTEAAIERLDDDKAHDTIVAALQRAAERSAELGQ